MCASRCDSLMVVTLTFFDFPLLLSSRVQLMQSRMIMNKMYENNPPPVAADGSAPEYVAGNEGKYTAANDSRGPEYDEVRAEHTLLYFGEGSDDVYYKGDDVLEKSKRFAQQNRQETAKLNKISQEGSKWVQSLRDLFGPALSGEVTTDPTQARERTNELCDIISSLAASPVEVSPPTAPRGSAPPPAYAPASPVSPYAPAPVSPYAAAPVSPYAAVPSPPVSPYAPATPTQAFQTTRRAPNSATSLGSPASPGEPLALYGSARNGSSPGSAPGTAPSPAQLDQECTFLGTCTCPNCR